MRKIATWILVLGMFAAPAVNAADGPANDKAPDAKTDKSPANTNKANGSAPTSTELEAEIEQLRALIKEQADQLAAMKAAMPSTAPSNAGAANSASSSGAATSTVAAPTVSSTGSGTTAAILPARAAAPQGGEEVSPLQFRIGTATIQPVGFMDFTTVWRSHDGGSGIGTNFASIPYGNVFQDNLSEFRFSMQNSRIGFRVDADVKGAHVIGYMESDYLGNNPGNVGVSSNSNTLRSRLYWADVRKDKWEVLGGQTWSLITPGRRGISPLPGDLFYTQNIDVNYQIGLTWGRIPEARFVYHPNEKVAIAFALDSPEQYIGGSAGGSGITCPAALAVTICGTGGATSAEFNQGGTTFNSPNRAPDIIGKVAFDPTSRIHVEAGGLERQFHDFNPATAMKFSKTGAGAFLNLNVEVLKGLRIVSNNFWSSGGGRYIFGQVPDLIVRNDGSLSPIRNGSTVTGLEFTHKNTLLYAYYGGVYIFKNTAFDVNGTTPIGYGFTGSANGQNRNIQEITGGFSQTLWKDAKYGALNFMGQYSYVSRNPWFIAIGQPEDAHLSMIFLNLRYTLPGSAPSMKK
jgi:hypothetical protein